MQLAERFNKEEEKWQATKAISSFELSVGFLLVFKWCKMLSSLFYYCLYPRRPALEKKENKKNSN